MVALETNFYYCNFINAKEMFVLGWLFLNFLGEISSARILCVFSTPAVSHQNVLQALSTELSWKGHEVVVFTPKSLHFRHSANYTEFEVPSLYEIARKFKHQTTKVSKFNVGNVAHYVANLHMVYVEEMIDFIQETLAPDTKFDLLLLENMSALIYSVQCVFKAPIIGVRSSLLVNMEHNMLGNPSNPILNPDISFASTNKNFFDRVKNVLIDFVLKIFCSWQHLPDVNKVIERKFGNSCPKVEQFIDSVSVTFTNTNPLLHRIRANVPSIVPVGGLIHIQKEKALPEDLQIFLDSSPRGVIYVSFGCTRNISHLPEATRNGILEALTELPYKVVMKWDFEYFGKKSGNILIRKWLPQQDLLRHGNVKVFVTQSGLQSIEEAIESETPVVAIPLALDQPALARKVVQWKIGESVDYSRLTKEYLKSVITKVAENYEYKSSIRKLKKLIRDQPKLSVDKAVWWIEHVLRTKQATHLKGPTISLKWQEYYFVDLAVISLLVCFMFITMVYKLSKQSFFKYIF